MWMSSMACHCFSDILWNIASQWYPALLTTISTPPNASTAVSISAFGTSGSSRSPTSALALDPNSCSTFAEASPSTSANTTLAPFPASIFVIA